MNIRTLTLFLATVGGALALVSVLFPWYNVAGISFTLLSSVQVRPCPKGGYCEMIPVSPILIVAFICTLLGGSFGILSTLLHRRSAKVSKILLVLGFVTIVISALISLSDAIVREGLSIGFYTDSFSAILFMIHIVGEVVKA
jgi:hypothetical protein